MDFFINVSLIYHLQFTIRAPFPHIARTLTRIIACSLAEPLTESLNLSSCAKSSVSMR